MSEENISPKRCTEPLSWWLASSMLMESKNGSLCALKDTSLVLGVLKFTNLI